MADGDCILAAHAPLPKRAPAAPAAPCSDACGCLTTGAGGGHAPSVRRQPAGSVAAHPCRHIQSVARAAVPRRSPRRSWRRPGRTTTVTPGRSAGTPNGSRSPLMTKVVTPVSSSPSRLLSGLPGGWRGNASARMPDAPTATAVRHATRAPLDRPPTMSGRSPSGPERSSADDGAPRLVEMRRRRRRATSSDTIWLRHERDRDRPTDRGLRDGGQIGRVDAAAGAVPEHEEATRAGRLGQGSPRPGRAASLFVSRTHIRPVGSGGNPNGVIERFRDDRLSLRRENDDFAECARRHLGRHRFIAPDDGHRAALARCRRAPDAVAVTRVQCPCKARALHITAPAERERGFGRLAWGREECLRIVSPTDSSRSPGFVGAAIRLATFGKRPNQSRIAPGGRHFMWSWRACSGHNPPPPRVQQLRDHRAYWNETSRCRRCVLPHKAGRGQGLCLRYPKAC